MTAPPSTRPTSHRAATPAAVITRKLLPPLAAVTAVVLVILLLVVLNSRPTPPGPAPGAVAESANHDTTSPTTPASTPPSPSPTVSASVAPPPVVQPSATQKPASPVAPAVVPVTVLNNSRRQGLAAHVAAEINSRGWPIRKTGNFTGRIRETTVYYAPGQRAVALRLAHEFGQVKRVLPRFAGLPGTGLTVVVTRDWTG